MPSTTVYLVSGGSRGIGLALVDELATNRPDAVVFAGTRDPSNASNLQAIVDQHPGKVHIVKLVCADPEGNRAVAEQIEKTYGRVDVVIASAGISSYMGSALDTPPEQMIEHFNVNVNAILVLFQTMYHLLKKSSSPKFVALTSLGGSLTAYIDYPVGFTCYGISKVALNYLARKIHFENEWITCFPVSPGVVNTDMAKQNCIMDKTGTLASIQDAIGITAKECATGLIALVEKATREKEGGEFLSVDGTKIPW